MTLIQPMSDENGRSPSAVHLEMIGALLAGDGLERVAELATEYTGAPVAVVLPGLGLDVDEWAPYTEYVMARLAEAEPVRPAEVTTEVPISSGEEALGAVLMLGPGGDDAHDYLHVAALAALTELARVEAREEAEQRLSGSLVDELRVGHDLDAAHLIRRAARLGSDLSGGAIALCAEAGSQPPGHLIAGIRSELPGSLVQADGARVFAILPGSTDDAARLARQLGRRALVGLSSHQPNPAELGRALEEAELVLDVRAAGGEPSDGPPEAIFRLLFRVFISDPEEVKTFYEDTIAPVVRYDAQYSTDLLGTLEAYLRENCNMNATAAAIYAHRHTVSYRLERVRDLTGLDPLKSEDRERLGLGLKAYRVIRPRLNR